MEHRPKLNPNTGGNTKKAKTKQDQEEIKEAMAR